MKKSIIISCLILLSWSCQDLLAQESIITDNLASVLDQKKSNSRDLDVFPWNGCNDFEVTIDLEYVQVTTTIMVCCAMGICIPHGTVSNREVTRFPATIEIVSSNYVDYNGQKISIALGTYAIDSSGKLQELRYKVIKP
ncbi:hypothetical protein [Aureitalea marina]|uniref:Uncharacterized protein n=1 Tax=Aureitalea marina TaxID=930804 RepID=A0A2S7KRB9_9FLAO|nr:hypothetical protein [Aureitalea marina]PQB05147.1 hypothetical protein BST85_09805 [Aureitalea marina]